MTVNLYLSDPLLLALAAKLEAEMPARVAQINSEATDGVTILAPALVPVDGLNEITQTPALILVEGRTPRFEWEGTHGFIAWTNLHVVIMEEALDRQTLGTKLRRQARAVVESVWDSAPVEQLAAPAADGTRIRMASLDPGPFTRATQGNIGWRQTYAVTFLAKQPEGL